MFQIAIKEVQGSDYVDILATKGKVELHILYFPGGESFDVHRRVSGKKAGLAGPMGKVFWSWEDVCSHYKQFSEIFRAEAEKVESYLGMLGALYGAKRILEK